MNEHFIKIGVFERVICILGGSLLAILGGFVTQDVIYNPKEGVGLWLPALVAVLGVGAVVVGARGGFTKLP